uniref:Uncharacterized protein n=1 Tax=Ditylenchus dipsaci TaxID=166011 RepID=A0A915CN06_9BILA
MNADVRYPVVRGNARPYHNSYKRKFAMVLVVVEGWTNPTMDNRRLGVAQTTLISSQINFESSYLMHLAIVIEEQEEEHDTESRCLRCFAGRKKDRAPRRRSSEEGEENYTADNQEVAEKMERSPAIAKQEQR